MIDDEWLCILDTTASSSAIFTSITRWSDGRLSLRGGHPTCTSDRQVDVIAITRSHPDETRHPQARRAQLPRLASSTFSVTENRFADYIADIRVEAERARREYDMSCCRALTITQNHFRSSKNSHIVALNITDYISADQPAVDILREIRRQGGSASRAIRIIERPTH